MNTLRSAMIFVAALLCLSVSVPAWSEEVPGPVAPAVVPAAPEAPVTPVFAAGCILFQCPWYIDSGCTCELVWCVNHWECGIPMDGAGVGGGASFTSACNAAAPSVLMF